MSCGPAAGGRGDACQVVPAMFGSGVDTEFITLVQFDRKAPWIRYARYPGFVSLIITIRTIRLRSSVPIRLHAKSLKVPDLKAKVVERSSHGTSGGGGFRKSQDPSRYRSDWRTVCRYSCLSAESCDIPGLHCGHGGGFGYAKLYVIKSDRGRKRRILPNLNLQAFRTVEGAAAGHHIHRDRYVRGLKLPQ